MTKTFDIWRKSWGFWPKILRIWPNPTLWNFDHPLWDSDQNLRDFMTKIGHFDQPTLPPPTQESPSAPIQQIYPKPYTFFQFPILEYWENNWKSRDVALQSLRWLWKIHIVRLMGFLYWLIMHIALEHIQKNRYKIWKRVEP